jgi:hypothetical protein
MAVLKDIECAQCDARSQMFLDMNIKEVIRFCTVCEKSTKHDIVFNGGTKLKTFGGTYCGRDWSGDVEYTGIEAVYKDGTPYLEADGTRVDAKFNENFKERIGAKRDVKRFEKRKKEGREKIFVGPTSGSQRKAKAK